jgi:hypothetical protein
MSVETNQETNDLTIAYMTGFYDGKKKREWVEITKGECEELYKASEGHWLEYAWAIEAKLKEKNA